MTERSKFGSQRYGLERRGLYACDSCLTERAYEQPPTGWDATGEWSVGRASELSPHSSLALAFGLARFLTALMAIWLTTAGLEPMEFGGLLGLYLIGAASAFVTPVKPRVNSKTDVGIAVGGAIVGGSLLRIVDRIGDSYPAVDVALACVFATASGWFALLLVRYGLENRRRALRSQDSPSPPTSGTSAL